MLPTKTTHNSLLKTALANFKLLLLLVLLACTTAACTPRFSLISASIDYNLTKSIQIDKITNRAPYGWAPMEAMFNNELQERFTTQTRLKLVKRNGDMHIAGEIIGYDQFNKGIASDGFSSQVQLKMTVNIRFSNPKKNQQWERQFSATALYNSTQQLSSVQEKLVSDMIEDLVDQIFNATVADW